MAKCPFEGDGIILFKDVADAMKGEKGIRAGGYRVKLIAPPLRMRTGCDLALEINLSEQLGIERLLRDKDIAYTQIVPIKENTSQICEIVKVTDFDKWFMVKSGNMKLSFRKSDGLIVNISGGGCPDIPYLNSEMVDKTLLQCPKPNSIGYTLCAVMLQRALEEAITLFKGVN